MLLSDDIPRRDANRPSVEIAIDLIYRATGYQIISSQVAFGLPIEADIRRDVKQDENTFVPIVIGEAFDERLSGEGEDGFLYRRIPISQLVPDEFVMMTLPEYPFRVYQVLGEINKKLRAQLTENDVLDAWCVDEYTPFELIAHPNSLVWLGKMSMNINTLPTNVRLLEEGSYRMTEDSVFRALET